MFAHTLGDGLGFGFRIPDDLDEGFGILGERGREMVARLAEAERPLLEEASADLAESRMPGLCGLPQFGQRGRVLVGSGEVVEVVDRFGHG